MNPQQPVSNDMKDPNMVMLNQQQQPSAYYQQPQPGQQPMYVQQPQPGQQQAYYPQPGQQPMYVQPQPGQQPIYVDPNQMQGGVYYQPQYAVVQQQTTTTTAQPVVVATTTTNVVNVSAEGKQAEDAFTMALIITFLMWFFGIGFCFSCLFWIPVLKYRHSSDERARRYGTYGQYGLIVTIVLNLIAVVLVALPIIIAVSVAASYTRNIR